MVGEAAACERWSDLDRRPTPCWDTPSPVQELVQKHRSITAHTLGSLLETPKFSDFVIKCGDRRFSVHRLILGSQSEYFEKLCYGPFRESAEGFATLEDSPHVVEKMLSYLYCQNYELKLDGAHLDQLVEYESHMTYKDWNARNTGEAVELSDWKSQNETLLSQTREDIELAERVRGHLEVYKIADKYQLSKLKSFVLGIFRTMSPTEKQSIERLVRLVNEVFSATLSTDEDLREIVTGWLYENSREMIHNPVCQQIIQGNSELAIWALHMVLHKSPLPSDFGLSFDLARLHQSIDRMLKLHPCPDCGEILKLTSEMRWGSYTTYLICPECHWKRSNLGGPDWSDTS